MGRTQAMLERAVASEEKRVIVEVRSRPFAREIILRLARMLPDAAVSATTGVVHRGDGRTIEVHTYDSSRPYALTPIGGEEAAIFTDHDVFELDMGVVGQMGAFFGHGIDRSSARFRFAQPRPRTVSVEVGPDHEVHERLDRIEALVKGLVVEKAAKAEVSTSEDRDNHLLHGRVVLDMAMLRASGLSTHEAVMHSLERLGRELIARYEQEAFGGQMAKDDVYFGETTKGGT